MASSDFHAEQISAMQDWLFGEPADDCLVDLEALRQQFEVLRSHLPDVPEALLQRCLEQFAWRALDVASRCRPLLLGSALPLPHALYRGSANLVSILLEIAGAFLKLIELRQQKWLRSQTAHLPMLAGKGLALVVEAYLLVCISGVSTPHGLWSRAAALALASARLDRGAQGGVAIPEAVSTHFKRLLLVATAQPESLSAREVVWVFDYLEALTGLIELSHEPASPEQALFWMLPDADAPPVSLARGLPPEGAPVLYFQAAGLVRRTGERIDWLEQRINDAEVVGLERDGDLLDTDTVGLPLGLTPLEVLSLLRRIRDRWRTPTDRESRRQEHRYKVQVCQGLAAIWHAMQGGADARHVSEWMVYNESPGGYAIMSVAGGVEGSLTAGMALALRRNVGEAWTLCVVRWIRADTPEQVELGLQLIAIDCHPISIGFRGTQGGAVVPALILPPMAEMRSNQAILAPAGTYTSRRFVLVRERPHLYVAQGRVLSLDMQTANLELFQYEIDPYPI